MPTCDTSIRADGSRGDAPHHAQRVEALEEMPYVAEA